MSTWNKDPGGELSEETPCGTSDLATETVPGCGRLASGEMRAALEETMKTDRVSVPDLQLPK